MKYSRSIILKDGRECILRNGTEKDVQEVLSVFKQTHEETDYLLTYPDESTLTAEQESKFLKHASDSRNEIEILAFIGNTLAGMAGIESVGAKEKIAHRAEFGISVLREYWGLGLGRALTEACIECAKAAGYRQLELNAVAENKAALSLYESAGFVEFGRNPRGFRSRISGWQELVLMRLELD